MLNLSIGDTKKLFPKIVRHQHGLIIPLQVWGTYYVVHCGILCFALIRWGAPQVFSFFGKKPVSLVHHQKLLKLWRLPKI